MTAIRDSHSGDGQQAPGQQGPGQPGAPSPDDPFAQMLHLQHMSGPWIAQSIYVVAALGVADHLADGPLPAARLAELCDAHAEALYRFCRALAAIDVLRERDGRVFELTALGATLRTDVPGTMRWSAMLHGGETFRAWADVMHSVRTGKSAFEHVFGASFFDYLAVNPAANDVFNRTMGVTDRPPQVLEECDFGAARLIVDLGGGIGTLLGTVLRRNPQARGVLLDLPASVATAPQQLAGQGVADRCEIVAGSFFEVVPEGGDTYILSRVLHNWDDDAALRLLAGVRAAMDPRGRLIVIDHLLPQVEGFHPGFFADLHMLVVLGGRDRTEAELRDLLGRAGFAVTRVTRGQTDKEPRAASAMEAVLAPAAGQAVADLGPAGR